jgi:Na+/H+-dicarboxylate symporter
MDAEPVPGDKGRLKDTPGGSMNRLFTTFVVLAMVLGVAAGWAVHTYLPAADAKTVADNLSIITTVFLRAIKMIIAPLVFSTLVAGIAHMEDAAAVGRVGVKTMFWFITASIISLTIGLVMVQWIQPGVGVAADPAAAAAASITGTELTLKDFLTTHLIPDSIIKAMANNEILPIVVFSIFVGTAVAAIDDRAPAVMALVEQVSAIMLKVTGYVMSASPIAIFAALASIIATKGLDILGAYAKFVGGFYLSLGLLWALLFLALVVFVGPRALRLIAGIRQPILLAFSTASSEAAYPGTLEALQKFGVSRKVASFVLPLGYSFNLDGSMMYCTFATLFIAQIYGVHLTLSQQITMLGLLMVTSKGMAGVPKASIVVIAATLAYFKLPEAGIGLILAVDQLLDMGRSATNVVGNSVASAVVARWEGEIEAPAKA